MINLAEKLEKFTEISGHLVAWLTVLIVINTFLVVILRYGFDYGSIALQESISYLHAFAFMLGAAYTLKHDSHVRVDIFYRNFSTKGKAMVDLLGTLLLLFPVCLYILLSSWDYVFTSWSLQEESGEAGGLAFVYILKSCLLLLPVLLMIQGSAIVLKNLFKLKTQD